MNRDSRILIYGTFGTMLFILAAAFTCGCGGGLSATLYLLACGFAAVGFGFAGAMEKWELHSAA